MRFAGVQQTATYLLHHANIFDSNYLSIAHILPSNHRPNQEIERSLRASRGLDRALAADGHADGVLVSPTTMLKAVARLKSYVLNLKCFDMASNWYCRPSLLQFDVSAYVTDTNDVLQEQEC